jgi:hypothetical protein
MQRWNFQLLLFSSNDDPLLPEVKPEITPREGLHHTSGLTGLTYLAPHASRQGPADDGRATTVIVTKLLPE